MLAENLSPQPANLSDGERLESERFLVFSNPRAHEGDRRVLRNGPWRVVGSRWVPEAEYFAALDAQRSAAKELENIEAVLDDGARAMRVYDASPSWVDIKREIPGLDVIEHEDGTKTCDFEDATLDGRDKKRLLEMFDGSRQIEAENSDIISARVEDASVPVGRGKLRRKIPKKYADLADRKLHRVAKERE